MDRSIVELLGRSALFGSLSEADRAAIADACGASSSSRTR